MTQTQPRYISLAIIIFSLSVLALFFNPVQAEEPQGRLKLVFADTNYDFELQRILGVSVTGGADINEVLATAHRIDLQDEESWYSQWRALADRLYGIAEQALKDGHLVSARESFQRACNYYRSAEFFLHANPEDPRILATWSLSRKSFRQAAKLMDYPVEVVKIPYQGTSLPGYFLRPDQSHQPRKTLIVQTGFDGTAEELYFTRGAFALKRGYNVLLFEGPGQGGVLREQKLTFRPDWEKVIAPVVDYALSRPEVDKKRLALMGISMGGYLVPRAAMYEHRLAALVANPGSADLYIQDRSELPGLRKYPKESNKAIREAMEKDRDFRWFINNGMFTTASRSPVDFLLHWAQYRMNEKELQQIQTRTLTLASRGDHFVPFVKLNEFYQGLDCPKTQMVFTRNEAATEHCQMGALGISASRVFDWLDEALTQVQ